MVLYQSLPLRCLWWVSRHFNNNDRKHIMLKHITIKLGKEMTEVELLPISDIHIGSAMFDPGVLKKFTDYVLAKPNRFVTIGGDICNFALPSSKSDHWQEQLTPGQQIDKACNYLYPIRDRILAIIDGNHDLRLYTLSGISPAAQIAAKLDIADRYFEGVAYFAIEYGHQPVKTSSKGTRIGHSIEHHYPNRRVIRVEHGTGAGGTSGGKMNRAKKPSQVDLANVYIMGHLHDLVFTADSLRVPRFYKSEMITDNWYRFYSICSPMVGKEIYAEMMACNNSLVGHCGKYIFYPGDRTEFIACNQPFID